jgi:folate-binding protein YgfZ
MSIPSSPSVRVNAPAYRILPESYVVRAEGPDAGRYLQARLTQDILSLTQEESLLAGCLDAQGRTEGLYTVKCITPKSDYLLIADGGDPEQTVAALTRFKVADRVTFTYEHALTVIHVISTSEKEQNELKTLHSETFQSVRSRRTEALGFDLVLPRDSTEEFTKKLSSAFQELSLDLYTALRIVGQRPVFPEEISPGRLFLEADLSEAISDQKGCYTGQEVIEKARSRGKAPNTIIAVWSPDEVLSREQPIFGRDGERKIGEVLTSIPWRDGEHELSLAFIRVRTEVKNEELFTDKECKVIQLEGPSHSSPH